MPPGGEVRVDAELLEHEILRVGATFSGSDFHDHTHRRSVTSDDDVSLIAGDGCRPRYEARSGFGLGGASEMLTRFRIEVEEPTAEACVLTLTKYEHALQTAEARRYAFEALANGAPKFHAWNDDLERRDFYNEQLSRELVEEVIEYDVSLPAYRGRRVVRFARLDTRSHGMYSMEPGWVAPPATDVIG